ncbi:MAG: hypothetical protein VYA30_01015 [Myxococcota bacterium]|nr:hypothetical protein [Myxococcota bacterium]
MFTATARTLLTVCSLFVATTAIAQVEWPSSISTSAPDGKDLEQLRSQIVGQPVDASGLLVETRPCDVVNRSKRHRADCNVLSIRGVGGHSMIVYTPEQITADAKAKLGTHVTVEKCVGLDVLRWGLATRSFCDAEAQTKLFERPGHSLLDLDTQVATEIQRSEWTQLARKLKTAKRKNEPINAKSLLNTQLRGTGLVLTKTKCYLLSPVGQLIPRCMRLEVKSGQSRLTIYMQAPAEDSKKTPKLGRRFRFERCTVLQVQDWAVWTQLTCMIQPEPVSR